jgi:hypothetical protein
LLLVTLSVRLDPRPGHDAFKFETRHFRSIERETGVPLQNKVFNPVKSLLNRIGIGAGLRLRVQELATLAGHLPANLLHHTVFEYPRFRVGRLEFFAFRFAGATLPAGVKSVKPVFNPGLKRG